MRQPLFRNWLLLFLTLTGLAGKMHTPALKEKDRKALLRELIASKNELIRSSNISDNRSLYKQFSQLALLEGELLKTTTHLSAAPFNACSPYLGKQALTSGGADALARYLPLPKTSFMNLQDALQSLSKNRDELIRYLKTTTDNPKERKLSTPEGCIAHFELIQWQTRLTREAARLLNEPSMTAAKQ